MGLVFLIDRPGYRLATDGKVLKRSEATVIEEITQAYVRAQGEINAALANLETVCARAAEDAYQKGLAKAAHEAAQRWSLAEVDRLRLLASVQPALAEMVADAVTVLAKGIDREAFIARALELLQSSLREASWARVRVHPDAVEAAEGALSELRRQAGPGKIAHVVADETLSQDGCVLESDLGTVDASLDTQLRVICSAIANAGRFSDGVPPRFEESRA
jgi:type III secretion protein L